MLLTIYLLIYWLRALVVRVAQTREDLVLLCEYDLKMHKVDKVMGIILLEIVYLWDSMDYYERFCSANLLTEHCETSRKVFVA